MQLRALALVALACALGAESARADVQLRGNYWRDRNTRVLQPEAFLSKEFGKGTAVGAHYLLDAITSASQAAGAARDEPFTELRNEFGLSVGQRFGRTQVTAGYSYSSESDYWAHLATVSAAVELFQRNTTLALGLGYGHDTVGQRMSATKWVELGGLDSLQLLASWTQLLSPTALFTLAYDVGVIGFGASSNGFQANAYRGVTVAGARMPDTLPFQRIRQAASLAFYVTVPTPSSLVPYVAFRPSYRLYFDDWSVLSHTPELRTSVPIGPVELRLTGRFYTQRKASFYNALADDRPYYPDRGRPCTGCVTGSATGQLFATADPKLSAFDSYYVELRLLWKMTALRRISSWFSEGFLDLSYGHFFNTRYARITFGDAEVAGVSFILPL